MPASTSPTNWIASLSRLSFSKATIRLSALAFVATIECYEETLTGVNGGASMSGVGRSAAIGVIFLQ